MKKRMENHLWYERVNEQCNNLADTFDLPLKTVVGIVVNLSAQTKWEMNILQANQYLLGHDKLSGMYSKHQLNGCDLIKAGVDPLQYWGRTSFKYRNFYKSILLMDGAVCIDTHMINLYLSLHPSSRLHKYSKSDIFRSYKLYTIIANWVRKLAVQSNYKTYQMQAKLWCEYRGSSN